jgi:hypothetical protein
MIPMPASGLPIREKQRESTPGVFSPRPARHRRADSSRLRKGCEQRLPAVVNGGVYGSVEEVVEAALTAVEQNAATDFAGTPEELEALLLEGLVSKELTEDEFWEFGERGNKFIVGGA